MFEDKILQTAQASILPGSKNDRVNSRNISTEPNPEPTVIVSAAHITLANEELSSTPVIKDSNLIDSDLKQLDLKERYQTLQIIGKSMHYGYSIISSTEKTSGLKFDQIEDKLADAKTICIGDLHGSYEKLVETLITSGLATMPKESALKFVKASQQLEELLANNPDLKTFTPQEPPKGFFKRLIERIFKTPQKECPTAEAQAKTLQNDLLEVVKTLKWTGAEGQQLILIGDMIGDRGASDTITLTILSHLSKEDPNRFIRIASNHDHCATTFLLNGERTMNRDESQRRAFKLSDNHDELRELYLNHLKELNLLHYDKASQTLYSHAPITPENFERLIANLKEEGFIEQYLGYEHINQDTIEEFVEIANQFYKEAITFPFEKGLPDIDHIAEQTFNNHPDGFLWKRCHYTKSEEIPLVNQGVKILVHGHDSGSGANSPFSIDRLKTDVEVKCQVVNLDNTVRKAPGYQTEQNCRLFIQ